MGHLDCEAAIDVHGRATCKPEDLDKLLANAKDRPPSEAYKLDHHYPGSQYLDKRVILYAEIGTSSFQQWHNLLKAKARNREIDYVFRHYVKVKLKCFLRVFCDNNGWCLPASLSPPPRW